MFNYNNKTVRVTSDDAEFTIHNDLIVSHRAAISINDNCPRHIAAQIVQALQEKWIEPVAYMKDCEYLVAKLSQND